MCSSSPSPLTWRGCGGGTLRGPQAHGNSILRNPRFRTSSAEVAAPTAIEERDALAPCVILARLLARREVGHFARRLAAVDLPSARVTLGVGTDLLPRALRCCEGND